MAPKSRKRVISSRAPSAPADTVPVRKRLVADRGTGANVSIGPIAREETVAASPTTRQREQGRLRQQRRRANQRAEAVSSAEAARPLVYTGLGEGCRRLTQYSYDSLEWIVKIGTCPSAGGARAPLANVLSHVAVEVSRWTVERYRARMERYMLQKERELYVDFLRDVALGLVLRFDETPMRLCVDGSLCASVPTMVRCVRAVGRNSIFFTLAPTLSQLENQKATGLLGALGLYDLGVDVLTGSDERWAFFLIITDGASVNRTVAKTLIAEFEKYPRLLLAFSCCWAHVLSNVTRKSLAGFPFGEYLRMCHVLQARGLRCVREYCESMLISAEPGDETVESLTDPLAKVVWLRLVECILCSRGPFSPIASGERASQIAANAARLFPLGPPRYDVRWHMQPGTAVSDYVSLVEDLFKRTPPVPVSTRWYSVETTAWFFYGMRVFGLISHVFADESALRYWPGDPDSLVFCNVRSYETKCKARMQKVVSFVRGLGFVSHTLVAVISSIPRWCFARALEAGGEDNVSGLRGIARAIDAFLSSTSRILAGADDLVEFLLRDEVDGVAIRMAAQQALASATMYLALKNAPYATPVWDFIRGEKRVMLEAEALCLQSCCSCSGMECKIAKYLGSLRGERLEVSLDSLEVALRSLGDAYVQKGGSQNVESEAMFSLCRALGLKLPYRPLRLATMQRELFLRFYLLEHRGWFERLVADVYGTMQNLKDTKRRKRTKYNGFTAFLQAAHGHASECAPIWTRLSDDMKDKWASIAKDLTKTDASDRRCLEQSLHEIGRKGPLGSTDRRCPVDIAELFDRLNSNDSELARHWKQDEIRRWSRSKGHPSPPYVPSRAVGAAAQSVLLPGDKCVSCKNIRTAQLLRYAQLRRIVREAFSERQGESSGLAIGLVYEAGIRWLDVVLVVQKPEKILCLPLEVFGMRRGLDDRIGEFDIPRESRLLLTGVFSGGSFCLVDFCVAHEVDGLKALVVCRKTGCYAANDGWRVTYSANCDLLHVGELGAPVAEVDIGDSAPLRTRGSRQATADDAGVDRYMAVFNDSGVVDVEDVAPSMRVSRVIDLDSASLVLSHSSGSVGDISLRGDSDEYAVSSHADSDQDLVSRIRMGEDDRVEISQKVQSAVDPINYSVCVSSVKGIVTCFWRVAEKNSNRIRYRQAQKALRKIPGARHLTASKSSLRSKHGLDGCVVRAQMWQAWHSAWVYDIRPSVDLPLSMPLPQWMCGGAAGADRRPDRNCRAGDNSEDTEEESSGSEDSVNDAGSAYTTSDIESTSETDLGW